MYKLRTGLCTLIQGFSLKSSRNYRRYARQPVRVHTGRVSEEAIMRHYEEVTFNNTINDKKKKIEERQPVSESSSRLFKGGETPEKDFSNSEVNRVMAEIPPNEATNLVKEIHFKHLADAEDIVRSLLHNIKSHKFRDQNKLFVAEGYRIVKEALDAGITPEAIYFTRLYDLPRLTPGTSGFGEEQLDALNNLPLYKTPYKRLQLLSSLTTCPGILGIFKRPESRSVQLISQSLPLTVVLDEVREPGNVGGILRTAAAVGVDEVILMSGCCDPWKSKVVRAACGAHFRMKLTSKVTWDIIQNYVPDYAPLFLADVCQETNPHVDIKEEALLQGSSPVKPLMSENSSIIYEDTVNLYEVDSEGRKIVTNPSYTDEAHLTSFENVQLPVHYYDKIQLYQKIPYIRPSATIIIGGETGISKAARKFAHFNGGLQIAVPLANGMDSLNTSVAVGVILYEMQRQFHQLQLCSQQKLSSDECDENVP